MWSILWCNPCDLSGNIKLDMVNMRSIFTRLSCFLKLDMLNTRPNNRYILPDDSFNQGRTSFNSSDPFGDSQAAWTSYEEDSDSGFRASWGQQASNPPSTQVALI